MKVDKRVMRGVNRGNVLKCILKECSINQSAIAERVDLSIPSVMKIVDELISEGLVRRAGKANSNIGKRPEMIELVKDAYYTIGVDVGRTMIRTALCDLEGNICYSDSQLTGETTPAEDLIDRLSVMIKDIMEKSSVPEEKLLGVGIAMPGLIEEETGRVILSPDFSWENVPLYDILKEKLSLPVLIENANLSLARAEDLKGAGKNSNFLLCVNMGHGIGAGLLLNGQPYKGCSGTAGELGHMIVTPNGPICSCGNRGCLEAVASGEAIRQKALGILKRGVPSMISELAGGDLSKIEAKTVFDAAKENDIVAQSIVNETAEYIGMALANSVNLIDPDRIVLCGGLTRNGDDFIRCIENYFECSRMRGSGRSVKIRTGLLGEYAVALGSTFQYLDAFYAAGGDKNAIT